MFLESLTRAHIYQPPEQRHQSILQGLPKRNLDSVVCHIVLHFTLFCTCSLGLKPNSGSKIGYKLAFHGTIPLQPRDSGEQPHKCMQADTITHVDNVDMITMGMLPLNTKKCCDHAAISKPCYHPWTLFVYPISSCDIFWDGLASLALYSRCDD